MCRVGTVIRRRRTANATVLIVHHDPAFVLHLRRAVKNAGYRPVWARDGREAVVAMTDERPTVILIDGNLPNAETAALISKMNRSPALSRIPRLVLMNEDIPPLDRAQSNKSFRPVSAVSRG
jgi:CheY-like chemotaxis protein